MKKLYLKLIDKIATLHSIGRKKTEKETSNDNNYLYLNFSTCCISGINQHE